MVSRLPTPSIKYMRPARQHRILVWAFIGLLAGFMITWPWLTLTVGMVIYLSSIPLGIAMQARRARTHSAD
jgi:phosphatidylserine synthase